jgi:hypothetical protein
MNNTVRIDDDADVSFVAVLVRIDDHGTWLFARLIEDAYGLPDVRPYPSRFDTTAIEMYVELIRRVAANAEAPSHKNRAVTLTVMAWSWRAGIHSALSKLVVNTLRHCRVRASQDCSHLHVCSPG